MTQRLDIHQLLTDQIIAAIKAGAGDLQLPWQRAGSSFGFIPKNAVTGNAYNGLNIFSLLPLCRPRHNQNWLQVLKKDNRAVFTAAAKASEAARYLASFSKEAHNAEAA